MMEQQVIYVFTHDSIALGEDGTTHQPVEQLANLRAVPGLVVIRPCDANETAYAWRAAIESRDRPVALILTRQDVPTLDRNRYASAAELKRGAYILAEAANGQPQIILIATGSEVGLIVEAQLKLEKQNIQTRLVSMPSWELFNAQPEEYRTLRVSAADPCAAGSGGWGDAGLASLCRRPWRRARPRSFRRLGARAGPYA